MDIEQVISAMKIGDTEKFTALLKAGVNVNQSAKDGHTPLTCAVEINNIGYIEMLIANANANVNLAKWNGVGQTPLYLAVQNGYEDIALLLIKNGASVAEELRGLKQHGLREEFKRVAKIAQEGSVGLG